MKKLNQYLKESLLDKEIDLVKNTIDPEREIKQWLQDNNILCNDLKINKVNKEYILDASSVIYDMFSNIDNLTNNMFRWGNVDEFTCEHSLKLKSLKGAPEECKMFNCSGCGNLKSLEGSPKKCEKFNCTNCKKLKSLKGAPEECDAFYCNGSPITDFKDIPKNCSRVSIGNDAFKVIPEMPNDEYEYFDVDGSGNITDLTGSPKKCKKFSCNSCYKLLNFNGAPEECEIFSGYNCRKLESINGIPKTCKAIYIYRNPHVDKDEITDIKNNYPVKCDWKL